MAEKPIRSALSAEIMSKTPGATTNSPAARHCRKDEMVMMQNSPVEKAVGGASFGAISQDVNRASRNDNEGLSMATSVLGISGSLRAGSFNTAALRVAKELAPEGMTIEIADISQIPLYNE